MKQLLAILLLFTAFFAQLSAQSALEQEKKLYPIIENGLWGFINKSGDIIIEPQFPSAGQFSEGLVPVRLKGTYGYINEMGNFVIQPKFDVAYSFSQGQAKVFIDGKPYFISKNGKKTFEHNFKDIFGFGENDFSIVKTNSGTYGVVNKVGKLVVDTMFLRIHPFSDGLAVVFGLNHNPYPDDETEESTYEIGVINSKGEFIVPYNTYKDISEFTNGYAKVELNVKNEKGWYDQQGIIDRNGKLRFLIPSKKWRFDYGNDNFSEGLAIVDIYSVDPDTISVWGGNRRYTFKGVINTDGEIVFSNNEWDEITPFKYGRAFVQNTDEDWFLIDRKGQILNEQPYQDILYANYNGDPKYLLQNAMQFVETEKGWGAIDTTGKFVIQPKDIDFNQHDMYWRGQIIFTEDDISTENEHYSYQYGFWNLSSGIVVNPQFHNINFADFTDDLVYVIQDGRMGYIDHQGKFIWKEQNTEKQNEQLLNIDYMNRGYFYASSPYKTELAGFGGWGGSGNDFKKISNSKRFKKGKLNVLVSQNDTATYRETYSGMKLYVANTASDTLYFDAQDSRLYLKIQAQDKNGEWKDIEYLPSSWCGNSYHSLFLPPNHNWEFVIPQYNGEFKTKFRAELMYKKDKDQEEDDVIHSNEYDGSINPGQFWRKTPYYPSGLMDPYYD